MAVLSKSFATQIINHITGNGTLTPPGALYLALATGAQAVLDASLTNEVSGGGYTRKPIVYGPAVDGEAEPMLTVDFDVATTNWGTISNFAICSGAAGDNVMFYGAFGTAKDVLAGMSAQVRASEGVIGVV